MHRIEPCAPYLPRRASDTNKYDYGRVLIVGGCVGYTGAPTLCAHAALRCGAGRAFLLLRVGGAAGYSGIHRKLCQCGRAEHRSGHGAADAPLKTGKPRAVKLTAQSRRRGGGQRDRRSV